MSVLIFSEKDDVAFELLAKARDVFAGKEVSAALFASEASDKIQDYVAQGAEVLFHAYSAELKDVRPEIYAALLYDLVKNENIETILIGSTRRGKQIASILAQKLNCGCVTDVIGLKIEEGALQADRYALAGNTIATESLSTTPSIVAIMPHAFKSDEKREAKGVVKELSVPSLTAKSNIVEKREKKGEAVNLEDAKIIVGVGKGFGKPEDLGLARELAATLNAELGCTRPLAVDFKWLAEDRSIGLSSKKVSPELYIAVGISGQIQHTVGVMNARTIVAINKTEDAPIFEVADYGIVGDLYKLLPKLTDELKKVLKG